MYNYGGYAGGYNNCAPATYQNSSRTNGAFVLVLFILLVLIGFTCGNDGIRPRRNLCDC